MLKTFLSLGSLSVLSVWRTSLISNADRPMRFSLTSARAQLCVMETLFIAIF